MQLLKKKQQLQKKQLQQKNQQAAKLKQMIADVKYTVQPVQIADRHVKFLLSQTLKSQYTAEIATRSTDHQGAALAAVAEAALAVVDAAEAVAAVLAVDQERCTMQLAQNAEKHARFHSSLPVRDQFTAEIVIRSSKTD
jgi:hypothetical protein